MVAVTSDPRGARQSSAWAVAASRLQQQGALMALAVVLVFGWLRYGDNGFTSSYNLTSALRYNAMFALLALGMTFVIMTGGIDLSVSGMAVMTSVLAALWSPHGLLVATGGAILVGVAVGLLNGGLIARFRIHPFVVTLATLLAARGMALVLADNARVTVDFDSNYLKLDAKIGAVPVPVAIAGVAFVVGSILLNFSRFGRHVLALGGNEEAARLAGLSVPRITLGVYALSGGLAGLTGAILAAQTFTGNPTEAVGWELQAIAAVVVGGTLLSGGVGSVGTTLVGVLLLGSIINILNFEGIDPYWQNVTRGGFLLIVVILQSRLARRRG
ncbi:MAG: Ribose ABC transport system, permease protein RbsC [uncultured Thermomicrobiales bacterium]|uniref:Ribose ABC transport system, permease protein RbsC n=1 Tax=uncultured Thermomicrobiales bacterium TaxID=1645740 RepID=A0A6J4UDJ9_9BACT|nr:MAG: Ribose ABC transport system, permease protein RbsC [uncultured Thermomicrobiales bacterium]